MYFLLRIWIIVILLIAFGTTPAQALVDSDVDGLFDEAEATTYFTDPLKADTDGDGFNDGDEINGGHSPLLPQKKLREIDTDGDKLWDDWEILIGTSLKNPDTDGDGFKDGEEVERGYDPLSKLPVLIPKKIEVSLVDQRLAYYFGDKKFDEFLISSGLPGTPTPPGDYTILMKRPVVYYVGPGYNFPRTKWNLMFKRGTIGNYYIHGAYWHNQFGQRKSHGCVNVPYTADTMGRLYDWAQVGTIVTIR